MRMQAVTRVLYMGSSPLGIPALEALAADPEFEVVGVVTQPDRPRGRGRRIEAPPVKTAAERLGILPVLQPLRVKAPDAVASATGLHPDVVVVIAFGQLLPPEILDIPRLGCVNVHASLLPRHRGAAPIPYAILSGDEETGLTTMLMDARLDTGGILRTAATPIRDDDDSVALARRLASMAPALLLTTLRGLRDGTLAPLPQDDRSATRAPKLTKEDGRIAWDQPAVSVVRRVRAMAGWPGAFTEFGGDTLKVWKARGHSETPQDVAPGVVVRADAGGLVVACTPGSAELLEVQPPGRRRMPAADFLRGHPVVPGTQFG